MVASPDLRASLKERAVAALGAVGLARPLYEARRRARLGRISDADAAFSDGRPVPPPRLRFFAGDNPDLSEFIEGGKNAARMIADRVRSAGVELESLSALLDFGCGCGRIARHWAGLDGPAIHGCDYNPELVEWCQRNLPFLDARRNDLTPPLPYADRSFDLVYAISVFTHLPLELQRPWIAEMTRILAPGGLLVVTLHGDRQASEHLRGRRRREYEAGEPVVVNPALAGTNGCAAFHPPRYARETLLANLEVVLALPSTAVPEVDQDLYLGRRR